MAKYYSYEQFICSILANYKRTISTGELTEIMADYKKINPEFVIARDTIRLIGDYIKYNKGYIWLCCGLDKPVMFNGELIPLKDYMNYIGGPELESFINDNYSEIVRN